MVKINLEGGAAFGVLSYIDAVIQNYKKPRYKTTKNIVISQGGGGIMYLYKFTPLHNISLH